MKVMIPSVRGHIRTSFLMVFDMVPMFLAYYEFAYCDLLSVFYIFCQDFTSLRC